MINTEYSIMLLVKGADSPRSGLDLGRPNVQIPGSIAAHRWTTLPIIEAKLLDTTFTYFTLNDHPLISLGSFESTFAEQNL
jgi:hypothetical protein